MCRVSQLMKVCLFGNDDEVPIEIVDMGLYIM